MNGKKNSPQAPAPRKSPKVERGNRVENLLARLKNHRVIAVLIFVGIVTLALLRWTNEAVEQFQKLIGHIHRDPVQARLTETAYQLGKVVVDVSYIETESPADKDPRVLDILRDKKAAAASYAKELGIAVDIDRQDFVSRVLKNYTDSAAARFYKDGIESRHGARTTQAYELGVKMGSAQWFANRKRFKLPGTGELFGDTDAFLTLQVLNEMAAKIDAETVSESALDGDDESGFNIAMQLLLAKLDGNISRRLRGK